MPEWIPVSSSTKGRLALQALREFGGRRFDEVTVGELAAGAGLTTGPLYHHFGSKLGLYAFVREDVERRLLDRMSGAAAARAGSGRSAVLLGALVVGFDFAVEQEFVRLLAEPHPSRQDDPVASLLDALADSPQVPLGRILAAAWRAALLSVADGVDASSARHALEALSVQS